MQRQNEQKASQLKILVHYRTKSGVLTD